MRGDKHGPAYYLTVSYAKGRTRQVYVAKDLLPLAERWGAQLPPSPDGAGSDLQHQPRTHPAQRSPSQAVGGIFGAGAGAL